MFAGDVEVDEVFTNNDVGDTITVISHLKEEEKLEHYFFKCGDMSCIQLLF